MKLSKATSNRIYILYFICAFLVVSIHSYSYEFYSSLQIQSGFLASVDLGKRVVSGAAVPVFFFMSGFMTFRKETDNYLSFIRRNVTTILIPMMSWAAILTGYTVLTSLLKHEMTIRELSAVSIARRIILLQDNPVLWFMRVIFLFQLTNPVWRLVLSRKGLSLFVCGMMFLGNAWIGPTVGYSTLRYWIPVYIAGGFLSKYVGDPYLTIRNRIRESNPTAVLAGGGGIILITLLSAYAYRDIDGMGIYIYRMLIVYPILGLAGLINTEKELPWWASQSMYLCSAHLLLCRFTAGLYFRLVPQNELSALLGYVIVPAAIVGILLVCGGFVRKTMPVLWKFLVGGR